MSSSSTREQSLLNCPIQYRISMLSLISITLVSSSLYLLPLAYSQELSFAPIFREHGGGNSSFNQPKGIAVDQEGNVYVADTANNRIQVFSSNGTFISKWGEYGAGDGMLVSPEGIAIDPLSGNVYVADTGNNRIQVFSSNGTFIANWGKYGADNDSFNSPAGIAIDQGNVYVADTGNNRIQVFSSNGTFISKWGEYGFREVRPPDGMRFPEGIAIDPLSGNVYVADTVNNRILGFASYSRIRSVSFSSEDGEIYGNGTRIKIESIYDGLKFPTAIAFLGPNDMLVLQQGDTRIMRIVNGQMLDEPVLDLGNTVKFEEGRTGHSGMSSGIEILHNDNGTSYAFLYYAMAEVTEDDGTTKFVNSLYRYDITKGKFTNPKLIFEMPTSPKAVHSGGKLMVGPDNNIYVTIGEIRQYKTQAQNNKNGSLPDGSSSILRFTPNGDPVDGGLL